MPSLVAYGVTTNPAYLPRLIADSVDHHTALMSSDEKVNGPVLNAVRNLLRSEGDLQGIEWPSYCSRPSSVVRSRDVRPRHRVGTKT